MADCKRKNGVVKVRKANRTGAFDDNRKLMHFAKVSSRKAIERAFASGVPVYYVKDGKLIKEGPNHETQVIKEAGKEAFDLREYLCHG